MPEQQFPDNARVKLRDGVHPGFYNGLGLAGMEGWIRKHQSEKYGYQRVFVEWDQDHWAYNGIPNGWTWEGHFDLAEEKMSEERDKAEQARDIATDFADKMAQLFGEEAEERLDIPDEDADEEEEPDYAQTLEEAFNEAAESESFFLVAIRKEEHLGKELLMPVAYHAAQDDKSSLLCQLQLTHLAGAFTDTLISEKLQEEALEEDDDE